jgi:hypothetical protein
VRLTSSTACVAFIGTLAAFAAHTADSCFDDIEQHYAWDDGGFHWTANPDHCPGSPQPASAIERKWGGSVQIQATGADAIIIEEDYAWLPTRKGEVAGCPRFYRTVHRRTRIAKSGVLYDTKQTDDETPQSTQRPLRDNEIIAISNIQRVPKAEDAFVETLGSDTIVGQPCTRIAPKQGTPAAGLWAMCVFVAPSNCKAGRYLQPMDLVMKGPDGQTVWHGRTSQLQVGARGTVVSPDSIHAP